MSLAPHLRPAPTNRRPLLGLSWRRGLLAASGTGVLAMALVAVTVLPAASEQLSLRAAPAGPLVTTQVSTALSPVAAPIVADLPRVLAEQRAAGLDCQPSQDRIPVCSHGADAAPASGGHDHSTHDHGMDPATPRGSAGSGSASGGDPVGCYGDGTSGRRVRAVYARPAGSADNYAASLPSFQGWAAGVSRQFDDSAQATGGRSHVRFATTSGANCSLTVANVELPADAFSSFQATVDALAARGFDQAYSKYLVWTEARNYCGIATTYADDRPGAENLNNGEYPGYARVDRGCWGGIEAHELVHTFGGVQTSAANSTGGFHCNDGADVMCYDDGTANSTQRAVCPASWSAMLDCRGDDYFHAAPPQGSYLDTHWNVARSAFLAPDLTDPAPAEQPAPQPSTKPAPSPTPSPTASPKTPTPTQLIPRLPSIPLPSLPAVQAQLDVSVVDVPVVQRLPLLTR